MLGRGTPLLALAGATVLAAGVAGCGGGGGEKIPSGTAREMRETASAIERAAAAEDCDQAQSATTELRRQVEGLPDDTDPEIVEALGAMVSRIDEQLEAECVETGPTGVEEDSEPAPTAPAPETPPEETTPDEPPEEEDDDDDDGENGGGGGGGGGPPQQPPGEGGGPQGPEPPGQSGGGPPTGGTEGERSARGNKGKSRSGKPKKAKNRSTRKKDRA